LAVIVLLVVMNWFFHKMYWTGWISLHNRRKRELLKQHNRYVFEVSSLVESGEVVQRIGLPHARLIKKAPDLTHLKEVEQSLVDAAAELAAPGWIFTGKGQSIQSLRKALRTRDITFSQLKAKAYWADGKTGLD
jgi:NADPH-dependent ferric siderophore reductase